MCTVVSIIGKCSDFPKNEICEMNPARPQLVITFSLWIILGIVSFDFGTLGLLVFWIWELLILFGLLHFGLLDLSTSGLLDLLTVGLWDLLTFRLSFFFTFWAFRLFDFWTLGAWEYGTFSVLDFGTLRLWDFGTCWLFGFGTFGDF